MSRKLSPNSMRLAAYRAVNQAAFRTVWAPVGYAVNQAVNQAVGLAVSGTVYWAVEQAVDQAVLNRPQHPNLDRFVGEISQAREGAP